MSAQTIIEFNLNFGGDNTAFTAALDPTLTAYDTSGSPNTYIRSYPLGTSGATMQSDFATLVTAAYPAGTGLSVYVSGLIVGVWNY